MPCRGNQEARNWEQDNWVTVWQNKWQMLNKHLPFTALPLLIINLETTRARARARASKQYSKSCLSTVAPLTFIGLQLRQAQAPTQELFDCWLLGGWVGAMCDVVKCKKNNNQHHLLLQIKLRANKSRRVLSKTFAFQTLFVRVVLCWECLVCCPTHSVVGWAG